MEWQIQQCSQRSCCQKRDKCSFCAVYRVHTCQSFFKRSDGDIWCACTMVRGRARKPFQWAKSQPLNNSIHSWLCIEWWVQNRRHKKAVKALHLAQMTESHSGVTPRVGTRIPYVVTYKPKQKLQAQWCEIPAVFFATGSILNVAYILNNHVLNVVKQILSLPMHEELYTCSNAVFKKITKWNNMQTKHEK